MDTVRIDKWLWAARFFKTRSLASQAVSGGHVSLNGNRVKPSRTVQVGDMLLVRRDFFEFTIRVIELSERRGPARITSYNVCYTKLLRSKEEGGIFCCFFVHSVGCAV